MTGVHHCSSKGKLLKLSIGFYWQSLDCRGQKEGKQLQNQDFAAFLLQIIQGTHLSAFSQKPNNYPALAMQSVKWAKGIDHISYALDKAMFHQSSNRCSWKCTRRLQFFKKYNLSKKFWQFLNTLKPSTWAAVESAQDIVKSVTGSPWPVHHPLLSWFNHVQKILSLCMCKQPPAEQHLKILTVGSDQLRSDKTRTNIWKYRKTEQ